MKKNLLAIASTVVLLTGCVVPTQYEKAVSVTKDASGNIVSTTETERVIQPANQGTGYPIKLEYLKGVQTKETK